MAEKHGEHKEDHGESSHKSHGHGGGGHSSGGHEEAHEGAPEWLISFADNVALMMGFFVILLAMNMAKQTVGGIGGDEKNKGGDPTVTTTATGAANRQEVMLDFALGIREAFNNPVDINGKNPEDEQLRRRLIQRMGKSETKVPGIKGFEQDVQAPRPTGYHAVSGTIPFGENSSLITPEVQATINEVAQKIRGQTLMIEVRGHTSSAEAVNRPQQSMKLAWDRSMAVAQALVAQGVDWWQLRLVICADHDRVSQFPSSRADDRGNSRVEVVITDEVVPDKVPVETRSSPLSPSPSAGPALSITPSGGSNNH